MRQRKHGHGQLMLPQRQQSSRRLMRQQRRQRSRQLRLEQNNWQKHGYGQLMLHQRQHISKQLMLQQRRQTSRQLFGFHFRCLFETQFTWNKVREFKVPTPITNPKGKILSNYETRIHNNNPKITSFSTEQKCNDQNDEEKKTSQHVRRFDRNQRGRDSAHSKGQNQTKEKEKGKNCQDTRSKLRLRE